MKLKALGLVMLAFSGTAHAYITLLLSDEQGGKLCIYENAQRTETITINAGRSCPHTKTFDNQY
ncbi:hypothetical protein BJ925_0506 [Rahnella aquatilis]|nr:hypothetical protein BJ925_0506 [Rahnella aquatilis]